jgi:hypothetical protein
MRLLQSHRVRLESLDVHSPRAHSSDKTQSLDRVVFALTKHAPTKVRPDPAKSIQSHQLIRMLCLWSRSQPRATWLHGPGHVPWWDVTGGVTIQVLPERLNQHSGFSRSRLKVTQTRMRGIRREFCTRIPTMKRNDDRQQASARQTFPGVFRANNRLSPSVECVPSALTG